MFAVAQSFSIYYHFIHRFWRHNILLGKDKYKYKYSVQNKTFSLLGHLSNKI